MDFFSILLIVIWLACVFMLGRLHERRKALDRCKEAHDIMFRQPEPGSFPNWRSNADLMFYVAVSEEMPKEIIYDRFNPTTERFTVKLSEDE